MNRRYLHKCVRRFFRQHPVLEDAAKRDYEQQKLSTTGKPSSWSKHVLAITQLMPIEKIARFIFNFPSLDPELMHAGEVALHEVITDKAQEIEKDEQIKAYRRLFT